MAGKVYFGNANFQTWIVAPQTGLKASTVGWSSEQQLLNGRSFVKRSQASHRRFDASWIGDMNSTAIADSLHTIKDFSDGIYGAGPVYWLDPYADDTNILPPHWASPGLTQNDWPSLVPNASNVSTTFDSVSYANNFPLVAPTYTFAGGGGTTTAASGTGTIATITTSTSHNLLIGDIVTVAGITPTGYNGTFTLTGVTPTTISYANTTTGSQTVAGSVSKNYSSTNKLTIIIPNGYNFYFGWHASSAAINSVVRGFKITPYLRSTGAASTPIYPISMLAGGTTRTNTTISGTTYSRIEININCVYYTSISMDVIGLVGQILPSGTTPATGPFITGRGTTKLEFSSLPDIEYYSANLGSGQIGMSASLVEVD